MSSGCMSCIMLGVIMPILVLKWPSVFPIVWRSSARLVPMSRPYAAVSWDVIQNSFVFVVVRSFFRRWVISGMV